MDYKVRFIDYPMHFGRMEAEVMETVRSTLSGGDLILRRQLREFEEQFAAFVGARYAVGVSNCTDGMHLALVAMGVGSGDEVVTVSHTFVATAAAIHHAGAAPVLVDIGSDHTMDVDAAGRAVTPRTRAILPVHLNGRLCDMGPLMSLAERRGITVLEDAAQALGASYDGVRAGTFGAVGCFSFYPAKLLGAFGDAGAVVTNDPRLAERIRRLRDHGRTPDGDIAEWSFNCRMDNLHAAILTLKLRYVPEWIERRRAIARLYHAGLSGIPQLRLPPPPEDDGLYFDIYQNYEIEGEDRDRLVARLRSDGVEIMIPWGGRGVHQFRALGLTDYRLPRTEEMFRRALLLPMYAELSDEHAAYVVGVIRDFYAA
jgi:dTDP-4-amino-4,6-dideoxygalactose transaminase